MKKAIVLFSGGLDSTTALALAINKHGANNVTALSIYYGQKHQKELEAAHNIAKYYNVELKSIDLTEVFKNSSCSLLSTSNEEIPLTSYEEQLKHTNGNPVSTYVPFRNGLFCSIAASMIYSEEGGYIYYGPHKDDAAGNAYPDTSIAFHEKMKNAILEGSDNKIELIAPFIDKTKADIVKIGYELKVPYELTWSCYIGHEKPCGKCGTCIDRKKAFELNNLKDPLSYEED